MKPVWPEKWQEYVQVANEQILESNWVRMLQVPHWNIHNNNISYLVSPSSLLIFPAIRELHNARKKNNFSSTPLCSEIIAVITLSSWQWPKATGRLLWRSAYLGSKVNLFELWLQDLLENHGHEQLAGRANGNNVLALHLCVSVLKHPIHTHHITI